MSNGIKTGRYGEKDKDDDKDKDKGGKDIAKAEDSDPVAGTLPAAPPKKFRDKKGTYNLVVNPNPNVHYNPYTEQRFEPGVPTKVYEHQLESWLQCQLDAGVLKYSEDTSADD